jgi:hypothetical protein
MAMPARNPRINVVLERPLYDTLARLAGRDKVSLSMKVRDLVKDALEVEEDRALAAVAEDRERSFSKKDALSHAQTWRSRRPR